MTQQEGFKANCITAGNRWGLHNTLFEFEHTHGIIVFELNQFLAINVPYQYTDLPLKVKITMKNNSELLCEMKKSDARALVEIIKGVYSAHGVQ